MNPASDLGYTVLAGPLSHNLRHALSSLISETYESTLDFSGGPPLHNALNIVYVAQPDLFQATRYRLYIELRVRIP